jgi:hypothetical protein
MGWLKSLFVKKESERTGYTGEEIELTRQSEPEGYVTVCQKMFLDKVYGRTSVFSNQDPNMNDLDRMVLPTIMAGSISIFGGIPCNESCPGYIPIPVEHFPLVPGGIDVVRCQRYIPKPVLEKFGGWEGLRNYALSLGQEK